MKRDTRTISATIRMSQRDIWNGMLPVVTTVSGWAASQTAGIPGAVRAEC